MKININNLDRLDKVLDEIQQRHQHTNTIESDYINHIVQDIESKLICMKLKKGIWQHMRFNLYLEIDSVFYLNIHIIRGKKDWFITNLRVLVNKPPTIEVEWANLQEFRDDIIYAIKNNNFI